MTVTPTLSAWQKVPPPQVKKFYGRALSQVPVLSQDILVEIHREYPGLPQADDPLEAKGLIVIRAALEHFLQCLSTGPDTPFPRFHDQVLEGRSLDIVQTIYRLGVRLAWRRLAEIGMETDIPPPAMYELADTGFQYIDRLVTETVRAHAEAAVMRAGGQLRLQRRLLDLLLTEQCPDAQCELAECAARIGWPLPETVAVAVLIRPAREAVPPAVGPDVLLDMECEQPRMVVPNPDTVGRTGRLRRATQGWSGTLGPQVPLAEAAKSLRWARSAVSLMERGLLPDGGLLHCTAHTEALLLLPQQELINDLARRLLAPLHDCSPSHRRRLAETLLAWLQSRGGAPDVANHLGVHPQTVRYRLRQIRELWGDAIDAPDHRFELELVLRTMRLRGEIG